MSSRYFHSLGLALLFLASSRAVPAAIPPSEEIARSVTIYRDTYGVPHIDGPTDASVVFGFAYTQAEDYFWQLEDSYIMAVGRYAEVNGEAGLENDMLNRSFEIVSRSKEDFEKLEPQYKAIPEAFAAGVNWFLKHHPEVKPRLLDHFEPWYPLAQERNLLLSFLYGQVHLGKSQIKKNLEGWRAHVGSNAWALGPQKTKDGHAMLFANPHQPYFGFGQWIEGHVRSGEGLDISGAALFGGPLISVGHNQNIGWSHTVNDPDVADAWIETFDDPKNPLAYRYDGGYRTATEWKDTIKVGENGKTEERTYTFRKTHHGPIVGKKDDTHYYSARVARLFDGNRAKQNLGMAKAKNLEEFRTAMADLSLQMFNTVYADKKGDIYYLYNGSIPKRDPSFDWTKPVDGSDPKTEWGELHPLGELPQVINPPTGYVQSCNSSPFTTTDDGSPFRGDYPLYMAEDKDDDKRRAKISRKLIREMKDVTFEDLEKSAFDTTIYWALTELPKYAREFEALKKTDPDLAAKVEPYLKHLLDWDCKGSAESTQATLCVDWYAQLYEGFYPAEVLKKQYLTNPKLKFNALIVAAEKLKTVHGDWQVPWGKVNRIQRVANVADMLKISFKDDKLSYPSLGMPGPLGVVFTVYYTPTTFGRKNRYAVVGSSFMGIYEFGDRIKSKTLLQFGQSGLPDSPHFFDQAKLFSEKKFKPGWYYWEDVIAHTESKYHPGETPGQ